MAKTITSPAESYSVITPHASTDFTGGKCRGIYVGAGGDIAAVQTGGTVVVFKNALSGSVLPIQAIRVNVTGTTANNLVALY